MNIAILNTPVYDYLTASLIEGLNELGHDVRTSEKSNYGNYLCKNEFIKFANHDKVDLVTETVVGDDTMRVYPRLVQDVPNNTVIAYADNVVFKARYDTSSMIGITYVDGVLSDPGTLVFIEAL